MSPSTSSFAPPNPGLLRDRPSQAADEHAQVAHRRHLLEGLIPLETLVFVIALAARLSVILRRGGLHGSNGYDAAVYFSAADAMIHGRMPYHDFVFLHPPGLPLALAPFALLTKVMSDESAFSTACLAWAVLGAVNAVLVMRVGRHLGLGRRAALIGALFYATWFGAVGSEYLTKLEPLGNFLFLLAVAAAVKAQRGQSARLAVLSGAFLGLLIGVKIWWIVPAVAVVVWHAVATRRVRAAGLMVAGAAASVSVAYLPVFLVGPRAMWSAVVDDQLGRARGTPLIVRLADLSTASRLNGYLPRAVMVGVGAGIALLLGLALVRALRVRVVRPAVGLVLIQLAVVLAAPSWFPYYADYLAVGLALAVAGAASRCEGPHRWGRALLDGLPAVAVATVTVAIVAVGTSVVHPFPGAATLARSVASVRCVMTDSPLAQIELNALSRGLADGCQNWVDVTGPTYGRDRSSLSRARNVRWQRDLTRYLRSGGAVILLRKGGVSAQTRAAVARDGVLARAGGHTVYRVNHPQP